MLTREAAAHLKIKYVSMHYLLRKYPDLFPSRVEPDAAGRPITHVLLDVETLKKRHGSLLRPGKHPRKHTPEQLERMRERAAKMREKRQNNKNRSA